VHGADGLPRPEYFDEAWERLAAAGQCDARVSAEYLRVSAMFFDGTARAAPFDEFIIRAANEQWRDWALRNGVDRT